MKTEKSKEKTNTNYLPDVLGDGFNKLTLSLADDYEGEVIATLIRRNSKTKTGKAILHTRFQRLFFSRRNGQKIQ